MKLAILISALLAAAVLAQTPTPKPWSNTWKIDFKETIKMPLRGTDLTTGKWYYDWNNKLFRIDRANGNLDRYCGMTKFLQNTPCNQYVVKGWRYIHYPKANTCCKCCADEHGCGIVKPNWFSTGAFELSESKVDGVAVNTWNVKGLQNNLYAETKDTRIPKRIFQEPQSDMVFNPSTYSEKVDASVFALPTGIGCETMCGISSICTLVRQKLIG